MPTIHENISEDMYEPIDGKPSINFSEIIDPNEVIEFLREVGNNQFELYTMMRKDIPHGEKLIWVGGSNYYMWNKVYGYYHWMVDEPEKAVDSIVVWSRHE